MGCAHIMSSPLWVGPFCQHINMYDTFTVVKAILNPLEMVSPDSVLEVMTKYSKIF